MYTILRFIAFVKCTFLLIILSNISIFILFSFSSTSMKSLKILYNFIDNNINIASNDVKGLLYWCWIKNISVKKYFDCWSLSMSDFRVTFTTCYLRISNHFFLKRRKQVISWNCFLWKGFQTLFKMIWPLLVLFLFLYWTQLVNRLLALFCSFFILMHIIAVWLIQ